jgi:hypothetical protein
VSFELLAPIIFLAIAIAIVRAVGVFIAMPKSKAPRQYPKAPQRTQTTSTATPSEPTT